MSVVRCAVVVMARGSAGHIEQLPSGSWRVKVYAGTDPLTGREIRLRKTCKTERVAQIELGELLAMAQAGRQAAAPAGRAAHPPHQGPGPPHAGRADRCHGAYRSAAARRLGSPDRAPRDARPVGGARAGRPVRRGAQRTSTGSAGRCSQAHRRADRGRRGAKASRGLVDGPAPVRGAPGAPGAAPRRRRRGGGHRGGQAGRLWPGRGRGRPGDSSRYHRRDRPRRPRLRRRQHLPAAERGTLLHAGPPGRRGADPRGRQADRAAAGHRRPGSHGRRAHGPDCRAARRGGDDAHCGHGGGCADRPGRGRQDPHDGRVRPAVDNVHRPPGHRPDHLDQCGPGAGAREPGREL